MLNEIDYQLDYYDRIREKYRKTSSDDLSKIPTYFKVYFAIERKEMDMVNKFYYAIMDYINLDIEPCAFISKSNDWILIKPYLDKEKALNSGKI